MKLSFYGSIAVAALAAQSAKAGFADEDEDFLMEIDESEFTPALTEVDS